MSGTEFGGPRHVPAPKSVVECDNQGPLLKQAIEETIGRVFGLDKLDPSYRMSIDSSINLLVTTCEMSRDAKRFANDPNGGIMNALQKMTLRTV